MNVTQDQHDKLITQFERWFNEEMPRLYRYLCYRTRDQVTAEEITSNCCEKALRKLDQYDPARGELRVWLFGIARNELRAYYREQKKHPVQVSLDSLPELNVPTSSPEQEYQKKEAFIHILRELSCLSEREQETIALRYGAGLAVQQIAVIMGIEENHVAVLLHRTIDKIKKSLEVVTYGNP